MPIDGADRQAALVVDFRKLLTGNGTRAAAGGALVVDGLVGVDVPFGRRRAGLFGSLLALLIGVGGIWFGWWLHGQHQPYPDGVSTQATVTRVETSRNAKGQTVYARVVTFQNGNGHDVHVTEPGRSSHRPEVGSTVNVSYRPDDPQGARIVPDVDWISWGIIGLCGLVTVLGGGIFVVRLVSLIVGVYLLGSAAARRRRD